MKRKNPYAGRRAPSARAIRRANTLSPRQQTRAIRRLSVAANRMIQRGLEEKLAHPTEPPIA